MILPVPAAPFEWRQTRGGAALVCRELEPLATHFFTTRSWRLGSAASDGGAGPAWAEVAQALGVDATMLVRGRQVHGVDVLVASPSSTLCDGDIVISRAADLGVAIQTADCAPVLLADRRGRGVAAVHAGWRGLARRAPAVAVRALAEQFGCRPSGLVAAVGPCIGACCYEVGQDVRAAFTASGYSEADTGRWFTSVPRATERNPSLPHVPAAGQEGRWYFDVWEAVRDQFEEAGVPATQIFSADLCTASHPELFCSYRRDGVGAGRLAAAITARPRDP